MFLPPNLKTCLRDCTKRRTWSSQLSLKCRLPNRISFDVFDRCFWKVETRVCETIRSCAKRSGGLAVTTLPGVLHSFNPALPPGHTLSSSVAYAENFHGGFIQWHIMVICIWCALFVTPQFDVIFMFPNQRFGEVYWHNLHILLHVLPLFYVSLHLI